MIWRSQHSDRGVFKEKLVSFIIVLMVVVNPLSFAQNESPPDFQSEILPIFKNHCHQCHNSEISQAGLSLETVNDVLKGGNSGPVIIQNKPMESQLFTLINSGTMPMGQSQLSQKQIDLIRRWIKMGDSSRVATSEREIMASILGAKCLPCHGRRRQEAGLDLRTREGLLKGGKSGPAIISGNPEKSLLLKRIVAQEMPPPKLQEEFSVRGLSSSELEKLRLWIAKGAPSDNETPLKLPVKDPLVSDQDRQFWSFQPPKRSSLPKIKGMNRVRNPVDIFLLSQLEKKGLSFSPEADRLTLMRRIYFNLVGLPPTPEEVERFLKNDSPKAYEQLVDQLLESTFYGERWARYWLDAVGYADSEGGVSSDTIRPHAFRYRDYVIRSLNSDKPYDQFLLEQIAGDELFDYRASTTYTQRQLDQLVATGFLRMGPDSTYGTEQNYLPERLDVVATQVEIFSSTVMGLTLACARCHDHKYDPLPQRDYYRLSSIFQTAYDPFDWLSPNVDCIGVGANCNESNTRLLPVTLPNEEKIIKAYNFPIQMKIDQLENQVQEQAQPLREKLIEEKLTLLPKTIQKDLKAAKTIDPKKRTKIQQYLLNKFSSSLQATDIELKQRFDVFLKKAEDIEKQIKDQKKKLKSKPMIRAMFDMGGQPTPTRILGRGEYTNPKSLVHPGVPSVLKNGVSDYKIQDSNFNTGTSGRRLALAKWLIQPRHALTSRVMVNRIWQNHFGRGLVATPGNFGVTGERPSHPKLLDWLAQEFVENGWSIKKLHRIIVTSTAYRQKSHISQKIQELDPSNLLVSRFPLRRLDADALRDSILKIAGRLDLTAFGPADELEVKLDGEVVPKPTQRGYRRSIYIMQRRSKPISMLEAFDAPLLVPNCLKRPHSIVSSQALQLKNSDLVNESSRHMAGRIIDEIGDNLEKQVERVYLLTLTRSPSSEERTSALVVLKKLILEWKKHLQSEIPAQPISSRASWLGLSSFCHTYLNSGEFLYVN